MKSLHDDLNLKKTRRLFNPIRSDQTKNGIRCKYDLHKISFSNYRVFTDTFGVT